jgi:hypothetical protein
MMNSTAAIMSAIAALTAATTIFVTSPAAMGDGLNGQNTNQAAIDSRIDQLAKPAGPQTPDEPTLDSPAPHDTTGAGSFPRSFLVPGTSTSVRVGGSIDETMHSR